MKHTKLPLGAFLFADAARRCRSQGRIRCTGAHVPAVLPPELCGGSPQACLGARSAPQLPYTLLPGSMASGLGRALTGSGKPWPGARSTGQKPYTVPGALLRRQSRRAARRAGFGAAGAKGQRPLPQRERSPAPPHKKIPRRALCLGKDLFCLLRPFFSPLSAGYFSPLPLRPC